MISYLRGTIIQKKEDSIVLDVNGVGFLVFISSFDAEGFTIGSEASVFCYLAVKENSLDLYGSKRSEVIDWFKMLLNVKGVGPKSALSVLSRARPEDLSAAIYSSSPDVLVSCGVSKKISESIVLELKNKAKALSSSGAETLPSSAILNAEAISALQALGYSREKASDALRDAQGDDIESKIRSALKILAK